MTKVTKDTVLIFIVEGDPYTGDLARWADAVQNAHYSGFDVSTDVWVVDNNVSEQKPFVKHTPKLVSQNVADDYSYADYVLGEQTATVRIDLRA